MDGSFEPVPLDASRARSTRPGDRGRPRDAPRAASVPLRSLVPEPPARLTRRRVLQSLAGAAAALLPALAPRRAGAFRRWCRVDPVFRIGGETAHLYVAARVRNMRQARALATGPTKLVLFVPAGVEARYLASDDGFGHGYDVEVEEAADLDGAGEVLPVRGTVTVPMARDGVPVPVPIRVEFVPRRAKGRLRPGSGEGTANAEIPFVADGAPDGAPDGGAGDGGGAPSLPS